MSSSIRPQLPESTSGDWIFFRREPELKSTSIVVSSWFWEYSREALIEKPQCLDWLWEWRGRYSDPIRRAIDGCEEAIDFLRETESGFHLAPWMLCDEFPLLSLSNENAWQAQLRLVDHLLPEGGIDSPRSGQVRRSFFPLESGEIFPNCSNYHHIEKMGCLVRTGGDEKVELILPVEIDLTRSTSFLKNCFADLVEELRREFVALHGEVHWRDQKGFNAEKKARTIDLKQLSALRLLRYVREQDSDQDSLFVVAHELAERAGIALYAGTSENSWRRPAADAEKRVQGWLEQVDILNGGKWMEPTLKKIEEWEARTGRSSNPFD